MARTIEQNGVKAADQGHDTLTFQAQGEDRIDLPSSDLIAEAKMTREGDTLILESPNGQTVVIEGYFNADPAPILHAPDGSVLTPNLVQSFVHSPMEFAANETASDQSPVGAVEEVKGHATVTRADGTVETITNGTPIYQGDVIETDAAGAVNIVFIDETSMAVSANARLAIDEYTYDPSTESGTTNFSVLRGLFVFTSGLIGRDDPDDVKIDTPVGSIGIRGTIIAGEINPGGESNISVLEGAIVIKNGAGEITLSEQFETVRLMGFEQPMKDMGVVPASEINTRFNSIGDVNPSLFSTINDTVKEQSTTPAPEAPKMEVAPEPASSNEQSAPTQQQAAQSSEQTPAATAAAPDVFTPIDSSVPSFDPTASSGLPSSGTVAGSTSTGLGSTTTSTAGTSAPAGTTTSTAPATVGTTPATGTTGIEPPSVPATTATPPTVLGTTPPPVTAPVASPLPFTMIAGGTISDISTSGTLVRTIDTGRAGVNYTISNDPNGYYSVTMNGTAAEIRLTNDGAAALRGSLDPFALGGFTITATLSSDPTVTNTRAIGVVVTDASVGRTYDLDGVVADVSKISDNYTSGNGFGYSITALGDVDNDGFDDFMVGKDSNIAGQNHVYKFDGQSSHLPSALNPILAGGTTVPVNGIPNGDHSQTIVSGIGDFNGDGIEDYVIGQLGADSSTPGTGNAAIISGANPAFKLNFTSGLGPASQTGSSVDGIGDFNNDGYADVIISSPGADRIYYQGGYATSWTGNLNVSSRVDGTAGSEFGTSLTGIGDWNGDGYSDFAIGAPAYDDGGTIDVGKVVIYGGNQAGTPGSTILGSFLGSNAGDAYGKELFSLGDIDGDGRTDLMIGTANSGRIVGSGGLDMSFNVGGYTVTGGSAIGDFNGDGYDDFTISLADSDSTYSYVVFGKDFANGVYDLNFFKDKNNALEFKYSGADNASGLEASAIGDINGDGYDDFAMGVPDGNGAAAGNGGIMVFYGRDTGVVTAGATAIGNNQALVGDQNNNFLGDNGFDGISMRGGAGRDVFSITSTNFFNIDGGGNENGSGSSTYDYIRTIGNGAGLDFTGIDFEKISGIEALHFFDSNQTVTLSVENIFNLLKTSDDGIFRIANDGSSNLLNLTNGTGGDDYATANPTDIEMLLETHSGGSASYTGTVNESGNTYDVFQIGGYKLLIDTTLTVDAQ